MPTPLAIPPWLNARRTWGGSSKRQAMARATKPAAKLSSERMASLPGLSDGSPISSRQVILLGLLLLPRTILVETIDHRQHRVPTGQINRERQHRLAAHRGRHPCREL